MGSGFKRSILKLDCTWCRANTFALVCKEWHTTLEEIPPEPIKLYLSTNAQKPWPTAKLAYCMQNVCKLTELIYSDNCNNIAVCRTAFELAS